MSVPVLDAPADELKALISGLAGFSAEKWEPQILSPPCGTVSVPSVRRTGPDEAESQLGSDDWYAEYTVSLYFDLKKAQSAQQQMVDAATAFVQAVDADPSLGGTVLDAGVTGVDPVIADGRTRANRPLVVYEITVATLCLVQYS